MYQLMVSMYDSVWWEGEKYECVVEITVQVR
jgi:hypothetical protein